MAKTTKKERKEIENKKVEIIREDLLNQLSEQNRYGKHFTDMVEDYINLVKLKDELQYDIDQKGLRYTVTTGNGFKQKKPNESVLNILKVNNQMLKILQDLDLKTPETVENSKDDGSDLNGLL